MRLPLCVAERRSALFPVRLVPHPFPPRRPFVLHTIGRFADVPPEIRALLYIIHGKNSSMTSMIRNSNPGAGPRKQRGAMGYVFAWLLGVPIPILILVALLRGCS